MSSPKIFLSYAREDRPWAEAFADALEKEGISSWLDASIRPGDKWQEAIEQALRESAAVILLVGPRSVGNPFLFFEMGAALAMKKRIIPVVSDEVERSKIPVPLLQRQYVVQGDPEATAREVARAVA